MANWYDDPITAKEIVETRTECKDFYDFIRAIRDKEIQARIDFYVSRMTENDTPLKDMGFPSKGEYDKHNQFISLPYILLPHELDNHQTRLDELEEEWQERSKDYDDYEERYKEAVENAYRYSSGAFSFRCRYKLYGKSFASQYYNCEWHNMKENDDGSIETKNVFIWKEKKIDAFNQRYSKMVDSAADRREIPLQTPSHILKNRGALYGARFGYSERESIFNGPTITFNKRGEAMATAKALDAMKDILDKHGAKVSKTVKKKSNTASNTKKKLRDKWIKHILEMKTDFDAKGGEAKGIKYFKNNKKVEDSYWEVEFTLQRQQLGLKGGKGSFELPSKENVSDFLQDMLDAISVEVFDAQLLSHQRKVEKAKAAAKKKKEAKAEGEYRLNME